MHVDFSYIYCQLSMRLKRKIPPFVFGVSVGLIIGIAFFVFKLNDLFDRLRQSASEKITVIEQPVKVLKEESGKVRKDGERFKINLGKKSRVNYKEVDSLLAEDSHINIAKDELLSVKNIKVIRIGEKNSRDTAAARLASVDESAGNSDLYFVEFWKTPLNSKGYRFTRNKVMLYGFPDYSNVLLYEVDNSYYLKSSEQVYKLFYGADFRKLEKVLDSDLLAKLN